MRYYNLKKRKNLSNKKIDSFLIELNFLCKKHKMVLNCENNYLVVKNYNKKTVEKMLSKIGDDLDLVKGDKEDVIDKKDKT